MYNILCVDDTEENLYTLEEIFTQYNIIKANNGIKAIDILHRESIDFILMDVTMPDLNGFKTAQLIQSNKNTKNIPIMFLTTKKDDETIKNAFKYGIDYLSVPFNKFELKSRVRSHLGHIKVQKSLEKQIIFNQSVLDSQKNIIFIHDDNGLVNANKSFFEFFRVSSIEEFTNNYNNVPDLFMEYENYFSLHVLNNDKPWLNHISKRENVQYNVLLMNYNSFEPETFIIDVNPITYSDKFVVTLTNTTSLMTKSKQFEIKATYDNLTKIYNRSKFNELVTEHYNLFNRYGDDLCLAIFDIDYFKQVNDLHGHIVGDETLIKFSKVINDSIRVTDIFARWGGEEFTLLMPKTNIKNAFYVVDNLRKLIENTEFKTIGNKTCSIGVTQFKKGDTIDQALLRADEALYEAKESGRNKVCKR